MFAGINEDVAFALACKFNRKERMALLQSQCVRTPQISQDVQIHLFRKCAIRYVCGRVRNLTGRGQTWYFRFGSTACSPPVSCSNGIRFAGT